MSQNLENLNLMFSNLKPSARTRPVSRMDSILLSNGTNMEDPIKEMQVYLEQKAEKYFFKDEKTGQPLRVKPIRTGNRSVSHMKSRPIKHCFEEPKILGKSASGTIENEMQIKHKIERKREAEDFIKHLKISSSSGINLS